MVPGVYEAVVVAPPAEAVTYTLWAGRPGIAVNEVTTGPAAEFRNTTTQPATGLVKAQLIGVTRDTTLGRAGDRPDTLSVTVPPWAGTLAVDVEVDASLWHRVTDFGVTVFDDAGSLVGEGPLNYAFGRLTLELDSARAGARLDIELFPGFAHLTPEGWDARMRVRFLTREPVSLHALGASGQLTIRLAPDETTGVQFEPVRDALTIPDGYRPLVEVEAATADGATAVRRGAGGRRAASDAPNDR